MREFDNGSPLFAKQIFNCGLRKPEELIGSSGYEREYSSGGLEAIAVPSLLQPCKRNAIGIECVPVAFFNVFPVFHGGTSEIFFKNLIVVACVIESTLQG